ncbi:hypothetical protein RD792_015784 [Penstemon davidsonii]|uniref:BZIP domain-containing protein n=1 Tax=Penstemon davidsonii TaxID=160366 RepID=A0ABR0CIL8_9LAMI|nr:hypothetical protein RD792_015784 [Penstemon davidsonii]
MLCSTSTTIMRCLTTSKKVIFDIIDDQIRQLLWRYCSTSSKEVLFEVIDEKFNDKLDDEENKKSSSTQKVFFDISALFDIINDQNQLPKRPFFDINALFDLKYLVRHHQMIKSITSLMMRKQNALYNIIDDQIHQQSLVRHERMKCCSTSSMIKFIKCYGAADGKAQRKDVSTIPSLEVSRTPEKLIDVISTATVPVKTTENINAALIIKDPSNLKPSSTDFVPQTSMSKDIWLQSERELRRERRKQSNRESARRSRLKKQALSEDLAAKVQTLTTENMTLKLEMNELKESSEKLRLENATLMVNLKKMDELRMRKPFGTVNLLARVNNSDSTERDGDSYENPSSGSTLRQLLDGSPCRTADAVAAG